MKKISLIRTFFQQESASGILLLCAAAVALLLANSPFAAGFEHFLAAAHPLGQGYAVSLRSVIGEGLMTLFFLVIGLELKREWAAGQFVMGRSLLLPAVTAGAGMVIPALIYAAVSGRYPEALRGWAVPTATDIAFSLGVLSLFGRRIPTGLVYFLMLLAILDDAGAVLMIALFYSGQWSLLGCLLAAGISGGLWWLGRAGVIAWLPWAVGGGLLWWSFLKAGIHPVLAGVLLAMFLPARGKNSLVTRLLSALHPWVAFGIMPLFALANAGVSLKGGTLFPPQGAVMIAVVTGLFLGKPLGVLGSAALLVRWRQATLPPGVSWPMFIAVAFLCGIGFTMSLFIGTLAFENQLPAYMVAVRRGVLAGSCLSGGVGAGVLYFVCRRNARRIP